VIHENARIGPGCRIQDGAVIGRRLGRELSEPRPFDAVELGAGTIVGAVGIVGEGASIGERALIGDRAHVREYAVVGDDAVIGVAVTVSNGVRVGARTRIQYATNLAPPTVVEEDVFIGPNVTTTNDPTLDRLGEDAEMRGMALRRGCRIGAAAAFLPGLEVGEDAVVAAGSLVTRDVPEGVLVMGRPARIVGEVPAAQRLTRR
jgi:acetyltransferase-like isoleucine patch superfamily enzyme